jgi:hypothetical protein
MAKKPNETPIKASATTIIPSTPQLARLRHTPNLQTRDRLGSVLKWSTSDLYSGRYRIMLYRFLVDHVPVINACIWTWVRMAAATGEYRVEGDERESETTKGQKRLERLWRGAYTNVLGNRVGLTTLLPDLFTSLIRDGRFGGFVTVFKDGSGIDQFVPVDPINIVQDDTASRTRLILDLEQGRIDLNRPDFYYLPFNNGVSEPLGRSILQPIPFVSYIEQQLVDDMRRSSHNSGYHRLHVKITPPDRLAGESEDAYTKRINGYFDSTVSMIRSCEIDDNPVTWDNVMIDYIGPTKSRDVTNSWFMTHRAMVEDICAGTNLAPHLLGYSYGATSTWADFKFEVVMRQVRSMQTEVAQFLEWMGNIDLALAGIDRTCRFVFDNTFTYQASDNLAVQSGRLENILKLYDAGLIDEATARLKTRDII